MKRWLSMLTKAALGLFVLIDWWNFLGFEMASVGGPSAFNAVGFVVRLPVTLAWLAWVAWPLRRYSLATKPRPQDSVPVEPGHSVIRNPQVLEYYREAPPEEQISWISNPGTHNLAEVGDDRQGHPSERPDGDDT